MLKTGKNLAVEIPFPHDQYRAFIVTGGYTRDNANFTLPLTNVLNHNLKIFYQFRKYEILNEYLENNWDVSDDELTNSIHVLDISEIEELEKKLSFYLNDFSKFDAEWKCDNPL